jgi:hypothetical protein
LIFSLSSLSSSPSIPSLSLLVSSPNRPPTHTTISYPRAGSSGGMPITTSHGRKGREDLAAGMARLSTLGADGTSFWSRYCCSSRRRGGRG